MSTLIIADDRVIEHAPPGRHPERPDRYRAAAQALHSADFASELTWQTPVEAKASDVLAVHDPEMVALIDQVAALTEAEGQPVGLDPDTHMSPGSLTAARLAAGAGLSAIEALQTGTAEEAFCLVRPPGHHATPTNSMGFCLYNNVAVAAQRLTEAGQRVAIVDIDAHHGNGTQDIFYARDDVLFVSFHEYPQYPGTGAISETGEGDGLGTTLNLPMPSGATGDVYLRGMDEVVVPALSEFDADWLLISAGFDGHRSDPLTNLGLTAGDYAALGRRLLDASTSTKRVTFLEGGYDLDALAASTTAFVANLVGADQVDDPEQTQTNGGPGGHIVDTLLK